MAIESENQMVLDIYVLIGIIGKRSVIVDACVSRDIAEQLRQKGGLTVRHVIDINPRMPDEEIAKIMQPSEVLVTKDYEFYRTLGDDRAIYLEPDIQRGSHGKPKLKPFGRKISAVLLAEVRETIAREREKGILDIKILLGLIYVFRREDVSYIESNNLLSLQVTNEGLRVR